MTRKARNARNVSGISRFGWAKKLAGLHRLLAGIRYGAKFWRALQDAGGAHGAPLAAAGMPEFALPSSRRTRRGIAGGNHYLEALEQRRLYSVYEISGAVSASSDRTYNLTLASNSATISGWNVNWGDGSSSSVGAALTSTSHLFATPGEFHITATVTDALGTHLALPAAEGNWITTGTNLPAGVSPLASTPRAGGGFFVLGQSSNGDSIVEKFPVDVSWGTGGFVDLGTAGGSILHITASQDGGFFSVHGPGSLTLTKYDATGNLDSAFAGGTGVISILGGGSDPRIFGMTTDVNGNIVVSSDSLVQTITADGSTDVPLSDPDPGTLAASPTSEPVVMSYDGFVVTGGTDSVGNMRFTSVNSDAGRRHHRPDGGGPKCRA